MSLAASDPAGFSVFRTLAGAGTARLERAATLGDGVAAAQWRRAGHEVVDYDHPGHHTLSLYLHGGEKSFRVGNDGYGGAGKFCVLPSEHRSRWNMNDTVRFLHLYIAPQRLAREAVWRLDCEPRELALRDRTYIQDPALGQACHILLDADWTDPSQRLAASAASETVLHHLLVQGTGRRPGMPARGGLAPMVRRRMRDYIEAHLHEPLTLERLAAQAALSTYHFARMFHVSFGVPPHLWVQARRLARAQALLRAPGQAGLDAVAQASGFGSASHLSRVFRQATAATPGQYRAGARAH